MISISSPSLKWNLAIFQQHQLNFYAAYFFFIRRCTLSLPSTNQISEAIICKLRPNYFLYLMIVIFECQIQINCKSFSFLWPRSSRENQAICLDDVPPMIEKYNYLKDDIRPGEKFNAKKQCQQSFDKSFIPHVTNISPFEVTLNVVV